LAPHLSKETLEFHHGKHHATYVKTLNDLIKGTKEEHLPLEQIIKSAERGKVFNNAAQHWNHSFYWPSMKSRGGDRPGRRIGDLIDQSFGDLDGFKKQFHEAAVGHFGSGWTWLVQDAKGRLAIESTHDAETPIQHGRVPLVTCDVWEHAYYIDYRNARARYVEIFLNHLVNWEFAEANLK
jgi:Fe-Mn family superoxide dismutase